MRGGGVVVAVALVAAGLVACGEDDPVATEDGVTTVERAEGDVGTDGASPASAPGTAPVDTASGDTDPAGTAPGDTAPATDVADAADDVDAVDAEVLDRLRAIVVQAADLPADAGWVQDPETEGDAETDTEDDAEPTDCLGRAFDAVGVQDLDESEGAVRTSFSAPDAPSFLTFGAAASDPVPDLDRLAELVAACDGVTDPDGTDYIVVRQPQFELVDDSISFFVNADQAGSMFNLVFVLAQRDDVTLLSAATAVVGEAEPDVEVVLGMVQLMLDRV